VSGGAFRLIDGPIDVAAVLAEVESDSAGAVSSFVGTVRARSRDRDVVHLEYEAYEGMAEEVMAQLAGVLKVKYDLTEVESDSAGAVASFLGIVRARSRDRDVVYLEYEAYEGMAEEVMAQLAGVLKVKYDLTEVAITHRVGRVDVGEASVAIAVSAPHRQDALAACAEAIDTLKGTVPLWKKEVYDGGEEWIGRGS
jgi:molybdopterin synthase catalytic subunit